MGVQAAKISPEGGEQKLGMEKSPGFPFSTAASPQVSGDRVFLFSPGISAQPHMGQGAMEQEGGRSTSTLEAFWYSKQGLRGCLCQGRGTAWGII